MFFKEFHKGVDSLYLSYRGTVKDEILEELIKKKELAQSDDEEDQALAKMIIGDHSFEVKDKARGKYAFVLVDNWYQIQVSASKRRRVPEIYVQVSSQILNCLGLDESVNSLRKVVESLLTGIEEEAISRIDVFIDFMSDKDFSTMPDKVWITRALDIVRYSRNGVLTGLTIGMGGDISARLYNKLLELSKSNKLYFIEIWKRQGWDSETVWRLEFQLKRAFLGQMSVSTISDFKKSINDVWRYCTFEWLRLGIDDGTKNRTRWATDDFWQKVQDVRFGDGSFTGITRYVDKSRLPFDKTLFKGGIGYITSHAAKNGIECLDDALISFAKNAKSFLDGSVGKSSSVKGSDVYFKIKVDMKKKRFNKGT